ncbi:MAG: kelch repeat-containing protein [Candidatus Coatesbacteria bacterium]
MPSQIFGQVVGSATGKLFAIGGYDMTAFAYVGTVLAYDPVGDTWATKAPMPTARWAAAAAVAGGKIYVVGGDDGFTELATLEVYDPGSDTWATKAPMPTPRCDLAAVAIGGTVYAIGGRDAASGAYYPTVEAYDPDTNTWVTKAGMPTAREIRAAAVTGNRIFAIGGYDGANIVDTVESYDPLTNAWSAKAVMPAPRGSSSAAVVNGRIFVLGGLDEFFFPVDTVEAYDPVADAWDLMDPMLTARQYLAADVVSNKILAVGGVDFTSFTAFDVNEVGKFLGLSLALNVDPSATVMGQWFTVSLTVTNDGGASLTAVTPDLSPDSGIAELIAGPVPAAPLTIQGFGATTFVWTWSGSGAGITTFTATVTGTDTDALVTVRASGIAAFTGQSPAALQTSLSFVPDPAGIGTWIEARLTVTNTGGLPATGVLPAVEINGGSGAIAFQGGPLPAGPVSIPGGGQAAFTWTFSASGLGSIALTATASGTDSWTGNPIGAASSAVMTVSPSVQFIPSLAVTPASALPGDPVQVVLTVTNAGTADATNVIPSIDINTGAANLTPVSGPLPAGPVTIAAGASQAFTWDYTAVGGVSATFTATASGDDTGLGRPVLAVAGGALVLKVLFDGSLAVTPDSASPGDPVQVVLTVTNNGSADVINVVPEIDINTGAANLTPVSGPLPAGPVTIMAGASQSFTWNYTAVGGVSATFTATASGDDTGSGLPVLTAASAALQKIVPCSDGLVLKALPPAPLYANGGDTQTWTLGFSLAGSTTVYNLTITTGPDSFQERMYVGASQSVILTGGMTKTASWATSLAGPWTLLQPPDATPDPLYLRWVIPTVYPGRNGTISWSTNLLTGPAQIVQVFASATLSCDVAGTVPAALPASVTATGQRIASPLLGLALWGGAAGGGDLARAVTVTAGGTVYAAGTEATAGPSSDWRIWEYNPALNWLINSPTYDGPAGGWDFAYGIALGDSGSVLVAGSEQTAAAWWDWRVRKYDSTVGTVLGSMTFNGPANGVDEAMAVAANAAGEVIVAGYGETALLAKAAWDISKSNAGLTSLVASTTYAGPAGLYDIATSVAVDAGGNILAVGQETVSPGTVKWSIREYNASLGSLLGATAYNPPGYSAYAPVVAVDPVGNFIVAGYEDTAAEGTNWRVRKYDPRLHLLWDWTYDSPAGGNDYARGVAVDAGGNVIVAGSETRADLGQGENWLVVRFDNAGNLLDTFTHDGLASGSDVLYAVAISGTGYAVVAGGEGMPDGQMDAAVAKYGFAPFSPPRPAAGLTAVAAGAAISISWVQASAGTRAVSGYRVYRATTSTVAITLDNWYADVTGAASNAFTDTNVTNGLRYRYRIIPVDDQGASATSSLTANAMLEAAFLTALLTVVPNQAIPGQAVDVRCRVKNTGLADAEMVIPEIELNTAALSVTLSVGPTPSGTITMAPGATRTFIWTYSVTGYGLVTWTATVTGIDTGLGGSLAASSSATLLVAPIAVLDVALAMPAPSSTVLVGQWLTVTLTITNTGALEARNLVPSVVYVPPGALILESGPVAMLNLPVGSSTVLTWTYSVSGYGVLQLTATVTGDDGAGGVASAGGSGSCMLARPAVMSSDISITSMVVASGQMVTVRVTVTNTGDMPLDAVSVWPVPVTVPFTGSPALALASGPEPPGPLMVHGQSATAFIWTYSTSGEGWIEVATIAYGTDSGYGVGFSATVFGFACLVPVGQLTARLTASPPVVAQGGTILVTMTVSNTGAIPIWSVTPTASLRISSTSFAMQAGGPNPASWSLVEACPQINCVVDTTGCPPKVFTWTVTALASGTVSFGASVFWTEPTFWTVSMTGVTSNTVFVAAAPTLVASASATPAAMRYGTPFTFRLTVTNTGAATVWDVRPALSVSDPRLVRVDLGPAELSATLANGESKEWVWRMTSVDGGSVKLTGLLSGFYDGLSGTVWTTAGIGTSASATLAVTARPSGEIALYPNPARGDQVTCYLALGSDTLLIVLDAYDASMHRVFTGTWGLIPSIDGNVTIKDLRHWAPGMYLIRATVTYLNGVVRTFPVAKLRVER